MDVMIVVPTFGASSWVELAWSRAIPSASDQAPVIHAHADTLAEARNKGLAQVETEFVIHLDADDELEPGYVEAMGRASGDLRVPLLRQVRRGRPRQPFMPRVWSHQHDCWGACLRNGNWIVIGAAARTALVREVGGWEEWGWSEDWALWARMWKAGAEVVRAPGAIYRAHVRLDSRNHAPDHATIMRWHHEIESAIWPEAA